jgi:hypothetical protein
MSESPPSFWKRWSRLKQQARPDAGGAAPQLPDLETLRELFRQPEFAARDGLDDYDGDYTAFEPRGELVTCDMLWASERTRPAEADPATAPAEPEALA